MIVETRQAGWTVWPLTIGPKRNAPVTIRDHQGVSVSNSRAAAVKPSRFHQPRLPARFAYFMAYELSTFM